jgi:hypothetical protein
LALQNYLVPNDHNDNNDNNASMKIIDSQSKEIDLEEFIVKYEKEASLTNYFLEAKNESFRNNTG